MSCECVDVCTRRSCVRKKPARVFGGFGLKNQEFPLRTPRLLFLGMGRPVAKSRHLLVAAAINTLGRLEV
jgi:hypothetical protein